MGQTRLGPRNLSRSSLRQIHINTDNNIDTGDQLTILVEDEVESALAQFARRITRVDVHLGNESAGRKTGADMRCMNRGPTGRSRTCRGY